jgi:hypothetical protein
LRAVVAETPRVRAISR